MQHPRTPSQDEIDQQPTFKRRRTALACTSCRIRKTRCNGVRPICGLCVELGLECLYEQPVNSNSKPRPAGYEDRLKAVEDALKHLVRGQNTVWTLPQPQYSDGESHAQPSVSGNGQHVTVLGEDDTSPQRGEEDAVDGMASIADQHDTETRFFGPSSNIAFLRKITAATTATFKAVDTHQQALEQHGSRPLVSRAASPTSPASRNSAYATDTLVLPPDAKATKLLDMYFSNTGVLFPTIHEDYVRSNYALARRRAFAGMRKSFLALLNCIFAISSHAQPDMPLFSGGHGSELFFSRAHSLIDGIESKAQNVETVQCLLLLCQYRQGTQESDGTWALLSRAVRIALQIGLHAPSTLTGLSHLDCEIRKRTWLNCVIQDRHVMTLSMTFGRPQSIPARYVTLEMPLNQSLDSLAMPQPRIQPFDPTLKADIVCLFTATLQLYMILGDIIEEVYGGNLGLEVEECRGETMRNGLIIEQRLLSWRRQLPKELRLQPWVPDTSNAEMLDEYDPVFAKLSTIIHLRYLNVRILKHRAILTRFLDPATSPVHERAEELHDDSFFLEYAIHSIHASQDMATQTIDVIWRLSGRPEGLGAWWFSAYYTFNACLVLYGCALVYSNKSGRISQKQGGLQDIVADLRKGIEAIERIGQGTRAARKIQRTLVKVVQTTTALAGIHAQQMTSDAAGTSETNNIGHDSESAQGPVLPPDERADLPPDLLPQGNFDFEIPGYQHWSEADFDVFGDFAGMDSGLGDLVAA